jgi:hypothetical protein
MTVDVTAPMDEPRHPSPKMAGPPIGGSAVALLRFDHERMGFLFADYEQAESKADKRAVVARIIDEWTLHTQLEHEIFYPAARKALQEHVMVPDFAAEHTAIDALIAALKGAEPGGDQYEANVRVLGKHIKAHAKEEQGQLFQRVKASDMDLAALGALLKKRKQELLADQALRRGDA